MYLRTARGRERARNTELKSTGTISIIYLETWSSAYYDILPAQIECETFLRIIFLDIQCGDLVAKAYLACSEDPCRESVCCAGCTDSKGAIAKGQMESWEHASDLILRLRHMGK